MLTQFKLLSHYEIIQKQTKKYNGLFRYNTKKKRYMHWLENEAFVISTETIIQLVMPDIKRGKL